MEGQTIQWPSERRVNGRTDNTMAIRKKGKSKDRQHLPFTFFLMAIVLSVLPFTLLSDGHCVVCLSIYSSFFRKEDKSKDKQYNGHQKGG
jgi:hypothetical protein